jgi:molybdenum cofactor biosynthesis enzyme MoaA
MQELDVKISYQCNNACVFCLNKDKRQRKVLPPEEIKRQIEVFAENGGKKLVVSGGEPLISKYFLSLIGFAKQKGISFLEIQTNARMLCYEEVIKKLKEFEPLTFLVSFHFPNAKLYKKYCRSDGCQQTVEGIKNLVKYNCHFGINTVIMKQNLPYLKGMMKTLKEMGATMIQYRFIDGKNVGKDYEKFVPRYSECLSIIEEIIRENSDINISLREIPVCVLGKESKKHLAPRLNPERLNLNSNRGLLTTEEIETFQFVFPDCKNCSYLTTCQGVRKEYVENYGAKEFKPTVK